MTGLSSRISHLRFYNSRLGIKNAAFPSQLSGDDKQNQCTIITYQCESDRGRIINSAAVRRLQQKTQVFPLERNAAVRSRLTHSLEVMQVGRFIARSLIKALSKDAQQEADVEGLQHALESIVEMSCLMHDIGNPPFGHFGEQAMQDWLEANLRDCICKALNAAELVPADSLVAPELIDDLIHFEGNAQGMRLITHLQKLNLTKTQLAAVLKYTRCGTSAKPDEAHPQYYLLKKVGYYYSEAKLVDDITAFHGLKPGHRHPVAYIMEAADDISYCIADLEDAVDKNILSVKQLKALLLEEFASYYPDCQDESCTCGTDKDCQQMQLLLDAGTHWDSFDESDTGQFFISVRSTFVNKLVRYATTKIASNWQAILEGRFSGHVLEDKSWQGSLAKAMKKVALQNVFNHPEVEANELKGYTVITGLLERYRPLLEATEKSFTQALEGSRDVPVLLARMCKKLPGKHLRAYRDALMPGSGNHQRFECRQAMEFYYRCRLIQDLISGMTDQYALDEYRELMGLEAV